MTFDNKRLRQRNKLKHIGRALGRIFDASFASAVNGSNKCQQRMFKQPVNSGIRERERKKMRSLNTMDIVKRFLENKQNHAKI